MLETPVAAAPPPARPNKETTTVTIATRRTGSGIRLFLAALVVVPAAGAQEKKAAPTGTALASRALTANPVKVLGGRVLVRVPERARVEARRESVTAAAESDQHETRIIADSGDERLVILASEMFALAGDDLAADVRAVVAAWEKALGSKYRLEPITLASGLRAVRVTPANPPDRTRSDDAIFLDGLFVASADHTVQTIDVYANPAAAAHDLAGCTAMARRILDSTTAGPSRLSLEAGEWRLPAYSSENEIAVTVPKNMVATVQRGPDFLVHHLIPLERLGIESGAVGIYLGAAPDFHTGTKTGEGVVFGKKVIWQRRTEGSGWETLCEHPLPGTFPKVAHVWIDAPDSARIEALRKVAESIRVVKKQAPAAKSQPPK